MSRGLFTVDYHVPDICHIPLDLLGERGIRGLLFDLDNTITAWHAMEVSGEAREWFASLTERGFSACIVSNSYRGRVEPIGRLLNIPSVDMAKKPGISGLRRACALLGLEPSQAAMVGDQLFTDILAANRLGLTTILTDIVDPREFWGTRCISRPCERLFLRRGRKD